jgi:hypothetical protein
VARAREALRREGEGDMPIEEARVSEEEREEEEEEEYAKDGDF